MFLQPPSPATPIAWPPGMPEDIGALTIQRLAELDRLRTLGLKQAEQLTCPPPFLAPEQPFRRMSPIAAVAGYERVVRAIRQIIVLEFELRGLFNGPDRDAPRKLRLAKPDLGRVKPVDFEARLIGLVKGQENLLDIRPDYRTGPLDEVVAGIRKTLGAEAPPNDPFAPGPERKPGAAVATAPKLPTRPKIAARIQPPRRPASAQPEAAQAEPARKAATLAIKALGGKGFRVPAKSKNRTNRGPPK